MGVASCSGASNPRIHSLLSIHYGTFRSFVAAFFQFLRLVRPQQECFLKTAKNRLGTLKLDTRTERSPRWRAAADGVPG